jgi:hypothetical protein
MKMYFKRIIIATSILFNVIIGGRLNQSFSAAQWERKRNGKWHLVWLLNAIFYKEIEHCMEAWVKWKIIHQAINSRTTLYRDES